MPLLDRGVVVYLDDILIYSKSIDEHKQLLQEVFSILHKNNIYLKESKCNLFLQQIEFLGHTIDAQGVHVE